MLDLSTIANAIKSVQAPPPHAQPSAAEEMKPVPQAETLDAVPPLPAKGGEAGLGEHLDLYDTEAPLPPASPKTEILGDKTEAPPPQTVDANFPFLKPLGDVPLGKSIDSRI